MGAHWEGLGLCRGWSTQTNPCHRSFNNLRQGVILNHTKKAYIKVVFKIYCSELYNFPCPPHAFHEEATGIIQRDGDETIHPLFVLKSFARSS